LFLSEFCMYKKYILTGFGAILAFLGGIGFLSYTYVDNVAPPVASATLQDCGAEYSIDTSVSFVSNDDIANPHRARDSITA